MILEKDIESYLKNKVEKYGGVYLKFTSPGNSGVPDRLVILRRRTIYVELKKPGETLRPKQEYWVKKLQGLGHTVYTIDSKSQVDCFIKTEVLRK
ncbi:VRR-NUC domain-containing protein [Listeria booriae]|uniref:VRR-NUC domain-containing protein n=1 Tax=Listeria booriae TaxID=1552123 RepID=UPI001C8976D3|nr:VRR-NUC domain-containing protein [Listeria booriae]